MLFIQVATGHCHTVALTRTGHVVSWGYNGDNRLLGTPAEGGFVQIAAGWDHSVARRADGTIVLWGRTQGTECGSLPSEPEIINPKVIDPAKFPFNPDIRFSSVSAGENITTGIIDMPEYPDLHQRAIVWGKVRFPSSPCTVPPPPTLGQYPPFGRFGYWSAGVYLSTDLAPGSITQISGVGHHVLLKRAAGLGGGILGWGMNADDGDGDNLPDLQSTVPLPGNPFDWVPTAAMVATGHRHSLLLGNVVTNGGRPLYGWGKNACGETGERVSVPPVSGACRFFLYSTGEIVAPPATINTGDRTTTEAIPEPGFDVCFPSSS